MAGHLARAGLDVSVYNRTRGRAEAWLAEYAGGGEGDQRGEGTGALRVAATPAEAAEGAEVVFACSGADPDLEAIVLGAGTGTGAGSGASGAFDGMAKGSLFVDHTTASARLARELSREAAARGLGFLDAPVSGGQAGAEQGTLTIMVGGEPECYARAAPLLDHYAKKHALIGPAGHGQLAKMVNQICIAGVLEGLSEGLDFARRVGLDAAQVVEVIAAGAAGSWQMDNRAQSMLEDRFDFGFAVDWMRKDLGMAIEEAARHGVMLPNVEDVDARYAELQRRGGGRLDTSSLIRAFGRARDESGQG